MSERTKRNPQQERYAYQWYLPSQNPERPPVQLETGDPDGYVDAAAVGEDSASLEGPEGVMEEAGIEETGATQEAGNPPSSQSRNRIYSPKVRSLRKTPTLGVLNVGRAMKLKIVALAGWSAMAGAGAVALLTRAGPFPGTQLSELGAVWAGIAAFLWIALAKVAK